MAPTQPPAVAPAAPIDPVGELPSTGSNTAMALAAALILFVGVAVRLVARRPDATS